MATNLFCVLLVDIIIVCEFVCSLLLNCVYEHISDWIAMQIVNYLSYLVYWIHNMILYSFLFMLKKIFKFQFNVLI